MIVNKYIVVQYKYVVYVRNEIEVECQFIYLLLRYYFTYYTECRTCMIKKTDFASEKKSENITLFIKCKSIITSYFSLYVQDPLMSYFFIRYPQRLS